MRKLFVYLLILSALVIAPKYARAQTGGNSFFIYPEYPQNQVEPDTGYFYLAMQPGSSQTLTLDAVNNSDGEITLYAETADAYTSPEGALVYVTQNTSEAIGYTDESFRMSGSIKLSADSFTLKPDETIKVQISVAAPEFENVEAIGAVRFYTMGEGPGVSSGVDVNVKSAQTIPVRIRVGQPEAQTAPSVDIGDINFDNAQKQYYFEAANTLAEINKLDKLSVVINGPEGGEVYSRSIESLKMAPKTFFRMYLDWANSSTAPGTYTVNISCSFGDNTESVTRQITIGAAQASELPQATATQAAPQPGGVYLAWPLLIMIASIAAAAIILFIALRIRKNKRR